MAVTDEKLDFWIQHRYNVLFEGRHGVGKTAIIIDAFTRNGLNWKYFSAATMDPWVDFIGVPKANEDEKGQYLDLVLPKDFRDDEIEAIFLDEYNRSPAKVRNAVMELIQFNSINGRKFKKLKCVWAAVNPKDDEDSDYDVEPIDPAQKDRFHIQVSIPYKPNKSYFSKTFGKETAESAISWWQGLPKTQRNMVSPRRLDYALQVYGQQGDMRDVLPPSCTVGSLISTLKSGPIQDVLQTFIDNKDIQGAKKFIRIENNFVAAMNVIIKDKRLVYFILPLLSDEKISLLLSKSASSDKSASVVEWACEVCSRDERVLQVIQSIFKSNKNKSVCNIIKRKIRRNKLLRDLITGNNKHNKGSYKYAAAYFNKNCTLSDSALENLLLRAKKRLISASNTVERDSIYNCIRADIPKYISLSNALLVMELLDKLAEHSHASTLTRRAYFMGIVNHCMSKIYEADKINYHQFYTKYGLKFRHLLYKISGSKWLYERFLKKL